MKYLQTFFSCKVTQFFSSDDMNNQTSFKLGSFCYFNFLITMLCETLLALSSHIVALIGLPLSSCSREIGYIIRRLKNKWNLSSSWSTSSCTETGIVGLSSSFSSETSMVILCSFTMASFEQIYWPCRYAASSHAALFFSACHHFCAALHLLSEVFIAPIYPSGVVPCPSKA